MEILKSIIIFILAGVCEIGGGYLVWKWFREDKPVWYGIIGAAILILYGIIAALQNASFAKVYATYGGFFIVMSIIWAMMFDGYKPDKFDFAGGLIALLGVCIIYYGKRFAS